VATGETTKVSKCVMCFVHLKKSFTSLGFKSVLLAFAVDLSAVVWSEIVSSRWQH